MQRLERSTCTIDPKQAQANLKLRLRLQLCTKSVWLLKISQKKTSRFALVQQLEDSQRLVYSTFWAAAYVSTDLASLEV